MSIFFLLLFEITFSVGEVLEVSEAFKTNSKSNPIQLYPYQQLIVEYVGDNGSITVKDYPTQEWEFEEWIQTHKMVHLKKTGIVVHLFFLLFSHF